jgi:TM2 domain-containing membrane protein YozV
MKKLLTTLVLFLMLVTPVLANAPTQGQAGKISGRSVGAAALSLIVWPGIGQLVNDNPVDKNVTHAVLGLTGIFRFWSCYDALVDRTGGVWHNRI